MHLATGVVLNISILTISNTTSSFYYIVHLIDHLSDAVFPLVDLPYDARSCSRSEQESRKRGHFDVRKVDLCFD